MERSGLESVGIQGRVERGVPMSTESWLASRWAIHDRVNAP